MRGKAQRLLNHSDPLRITPAYAGKRPSLAPVPGACGGSPPRMRGKGADCPADRDPERITPAYAGKSRRCSPQTSDSWDHPRVCGEKVRPLSALPARPGSPPRMRGKVTLLYALADKEGITPAYAGKRSSHAPRACIYRDHPRVCGEKSLSVLAHGQALRITPAYAGKSKSAAPLISRAGDHPRVCGEKSSGGRETYRTGGSPPRMRGKDGLTMSHLPPLGITPAYAGKSVPL